MAQTKKVIEIKKRKLKQELSKENPNKQVVERLKESINRHMKLERKNKQFRNKRRKWEN